MTACKVTRNSLGGHFFNQLGVPDDEASLRVFAGEAWTRSVLETRSIERAWLAFLYGETHNLARVVGPRSRVQRGDRTRRGRRGGVDVVGPFLFVVLHVVLVAFELAPASRARREYRAQRHRERTHGGFFLLDGSRTLERTVLGDVGPPEARRAARVGRDRRNARHRARIDPSRPRSALRGFATRLGRSNGDGRRLHTRRARDRGGRLPPLLRVFLLTLAITDDVLSVVVLSVSGTTHLRRDGLIALAVVVVVGALVARRATSNVASGLLLVVLWICFAWANIEPALAGVLAGVLVTSRAPSRQRLERDATRLSVGVVLPLFALVACGLHWDNLQLSGAVGTVVVATIAIRLVGKTLGITAGVAIARLLRFRLDPSLTWPLVATTALLCAIGFTVPLLFATKFFGAQSTLYAGFALGLLMSSAIAAILGGVLLRLQHRPD